MEQLIFISLLLNALAVILVVLLVYKGDKTISEFKPYVKDISTNREKLDLEVKKAFQQAEELADQIVKNATIGGQKNLEVTNNSLRELQARLSAGIEETLTSVQAELRQASSQSIAEYQKELVAINEQLTQQANNLNQRIAESANVHLQELADKVEEQVVDVRKATEEKVNLRISEIDEKVKAVADEKAKFIEAHIYQILSEIAKKTLGSSIDVSKHEDLVMEALEKAKKENIF